MKNVAVIILAAGQGRRMNAGTKNKVVFELAQKPIVQYVVELFAKLQVGQIVVVVGHASESVREVLGDTVTYAVQESPSGTANALQAGLQHVSPEIESIISVHGDDSAFYTEELISALCHTHQTTNADLTLTTISLEDPTGIGRIIRNDSGEAQRIVEEKNASEQEKSIKEVNIGLYCFRAAWIKSAISQIQRNPVSQEYYLTDILEVARKNHSRISILQWPNPHIWFGVNTREQLEQANNKMTATHD